MKRILCLILAAVMLISVTACGAVSFDKSLAENLTADAPENVYYSSSLSGKGDYVIVSSMEIAPDYGLGYDKIEAGEYDEKRIYSANLHAQTKEFDSDLAALRALVSSAGGYEETFSTTGVGYGTESYYTRRANMTLRLPVGGLDGFLSSIRGLVNVTSESMGMTNATEEYYDLEARVEVLRTEQAAYEAMMEKAVETEDLLAIKDRLYDVISEIESAVSRMNVINSRADYSTVTLTLEEVKEISTVTTPKTTFGARITEAFRESWLAFADGFQAFTVWLVGAIPTLLVIAVIGGAVAVALLISHRRYKKRMAEKKKEDDSVKF